MVTERRRRRMREKRNRRQLHKLQGQKLLLVTVSCCDDMAVEQLQAPPTVLTAQETTQTEHSNHLDW
jgi:hypothetical protein